MLLGAMACVGPRASAAVGPSDQPAPARAASDAAQNAGWSDAIRLSEPGNEAGTSINFARALAADARGGVHLVWREQRAGGAVVVYRRSTDGGLNWAAPVVLGEAPGPPESGNPTIAVSGGIVHAAWWKQAQSPPAPAQVVYRRSLDGGATWGPAEARTASRRGAAFPSIATRGEDVHLVYIDQREGQAEVYAVRSLDSGASWLEPQRLSPTPHNSYTPTVVATGEDVYVAWTDARHSSTESTLEEEYLRRSPDRGATWLPERRLTVDPADRPANSWAPSLAARGKDLWIAWFDDRDRPQGRFRIYLDRSEDSGATFSGNRALTDGPGASLRPVLALSDKELWLTWWDTRDGREQVYIKHSDDLGRTWTADTRLTRRTGPATYPHVAIGPGAVHVAWTDASDGVRGVYYKRLPGPE